MASLSLAVGLKKMLVDGWMGGWVDGWMGGWVVNGLIGGLVVELR